MLQKYRLVDPHLWRGKWVLGAILTSSLLLASAVWAASTSPASSKAPLLNLVGLTMKTTQDGWAIGSLLPTPSKIFLVHTSDAGRRWTNVTPRRVMLSVAGISGQQFLPSTVTDYLNGRTAITAMETSVSRNGTGTFLLSRTSDGGTHWTQWKAHLPHLVDQSLSDPILKAVDFLNTREGWLEFGPASSAAAGMVYPGMELWQTTNGGRSWTRKDQISGRSWIVAGIVMFTSLNDGWMTEGANHRMPVLLHTMNGGRTWTKAALGAVPGGCPTFTGRFGVIRVLNAALTNNQILRTTDGGHHWSAPFRLPGQLVPVTRSSKTPNPKIPSIFSAYVQQIGGLLIWDLEGQRLWRSTNGGTTWNLQDTASGLSRMGGIDFINRHVGWTKEKNRLWMTTSGGKHWTSWLPELLR